MNKEVWELAKLIHETRTNMCFGTGWHPPYRQQWPGPEVTHANYGHDDNPIYASQTHVDIAVAQAKAVLKWTKQQSAPTEKPKARVMNNEDLRLEMNRLRVAFDCADGKAKMEVAREIIDVCLVNSCWDKCGSLYYEANSLVGK